MKVKWTMGKNERCRNIYRLKLRSLDATGSIKSEIYYLFSFHNATLVLVCCKLFPQLSGLSKFSKQVFVLTDWEFTPRIQGELVQSSFW